MNKTNQILRCGYCYADLTKDEKHDCPKLPKPESKTLYCFDSCRLFNFFKQHESKEHKAEQTNKKDDLPPH